MKIIFFTAVCLFWFSGSAQKPDTFKDVQQVIPAIQLEVRYFSTDNFVGRRIDLRKIEGELQGVCHTCGSSKMYDIMLNGDVRKRAYVYLRSNGYQVKFAEN